MIFLLANWKWLAPTAIATVLGAWLVVVKLELADLKLADAQFQTTSEKALAAEQSRRLAAEQKQEATNNTIEENHARDLATINDAHAAYDALIATRVRPYHKCPADPTAGTKTDHPVNDSDLESAGLFVPTATLRSLGDLASAADSTVAAMMACQAWAVSVGR